MLGHFKLDVLKLVVQELSPDQAFYFQCCVNV